MGEAASFFSYLYTFRLPISPARGSRSFPQAMRARRFRTAGQMTIFPVSPFCERVFEMRHRG